MAGNGTPQRATSDPTSNFIGVSQPTNALIPAEQIMEEAHALAMVPLVVVPALVRNEGLRGPDHGSAEPLIWPTRGCDLSCPRSPARSSLPHKIQKQKARAHCPYQRPPTGMSAPRKLGVQQLFKDDGMSGPSAPSSGEPKSPLPQDQIAVFTPSCVAVGKEQEEPFNLSP
jgi:hypothetical protein